MTPSEAAGIFGAVLALGAVAEQVRARLAAPSAPSADFERRLLGIEASLAHDRERVQAHREEVLVTLAVIRGDVRRARRRNEENGHE